MIGDAALVVSELGAGGNAVRHAAPLPGGVLEVSWTVDAGYVRLRVSDRGGPSVPVRHDAGPEDVRGRGLVIVAALALDWGVVPPGTGAVRRARSGSSCRSRPEPLHLLGQHGRPPLPSAARSRSANAPFVSSSAACQRSACSGRYSSTSSAICSWLHPMARRNASPPSGSASMPIGTGSPCRFSAAKCSPPRSSRSSIAACTASSAGALGRGALHLPRVDQGSVPVQSASTTASIRSAVSISPGRPARWVRPQAAAAAR